MNSIPCKIKTIKNTLHAREIFKEMAIVINRHIPNHNLNLILHKKEFELIASKDYDRNSLCCFFSSLSKELAVYNIYSYQDILDLLLENDVIANVFNLFDASFCYLEKERVLLLKETVNIAKFTDSKPFNGMSVLQLMEEYYEFEHPMEKLSVMYFLSEEGCAYCSLCIGVRFFSLSENEPRVMDIPLFAYKCIKSGLDGLLQNKSSSYAIYIKSYFLALLSEAKAKICVISRDFRGIVEFDVAPHIAWLISHASKSSIYYKIALEFTEDGGSESTANPILDLRFAEGLELCDSTFYKLAN